MENGGPRPITPEAQPPATASAGKKRPRLSTLNIADSTHAENGPNRAGAAAVPPALAWWRDVAAHTSGAVTTLGVVSRPPSVGSAAQRQDTDGATPRTKFSHLFGASELGAITGVADQYAATSASSPASGDDAGTVGGLKRPRMAVGAATGSGNSPGFFQKSTTSNPFSARNAPSFRYAVVATQGKRRAHEDRYAVIANLLGVRPYTFYGVFDGHGGHAAAEHAAMHLCEYIEQCWNEDDIPAGLADAFARADETFLRTVCASTNDAFRVEPARTGRASGPLLGLQPAAAALREPHVTPGDHHRADDIARADVVLPLPSEGSMETSKPVGSNQSGKRANPFAAASRSTRNLSLAAVAAAQAPDPKDSGPSHSSRALISIPATVDGAFETPPGSGNCAAGATAQTQSDTLVRPYQQLLGGALGSPFSTLEYDGTTAVVAITLGYRLVVAHVGDSRAMLVKRDGRVEALTEDHTTSRPVERARVLEHGGTIDADGRVDGILQMTRTIGDAKLKTRGLTAVPEVRLVDLDAATDAVVILASDGAWDVMSHDDVARIVMSSVVKIDSTAVSPLSSGPTGQHVAPIVSSPLAKAPVVLPRRMQDDMAETSSHSASEHAPSLADHTAKPPGTGSAEAAAAPRIDAGGQADPKPAVARSPAHRPPSLHSSPRLLGLQSARGGQGLRLAEPRTIAERIVAEARVLGAQDNITVMVIDLTRPAAAAAPGSV